MNQTQDFATESWPISRPVPYKKNARKWSQKAIEKVAASIREFGWRQPLVCDAEDVIVIGHLRLAAAQFLGLEQVPVHVARDLSPAKVRALRLADNRLHEEATWDEGLLREDMLDLKGLDLDLSLTGFTSRELEALLRVDRADEDEVPPAPEAVVTKLSDLWLMGEHRLLCGDALDDWSADVMLTDPPYGVGVNYGAFEDTRDNVSRLIPRIMGAVDRCKVTLITSGVACMWLYPEPSWLLAWIHPAPMGICPWGFQGINPVLAYGEDPYLKSGLGSRPDSLVLAADREGVEGHPTPKPMKVWKWLLERCSPWVTDTVFDPFMGSGTTLIACESTGRKCSGAELEPKYCDVIVSRWQNFTGREAVLEGDGRTFSAIEAERKEQCATA